MTSSPPIWARAMIELWRTVVSGSLKVPSRMAFLHSLSPILPNASTMWLRTFAELSFRAGSKCANASWSLPRTHDLGHCESYHATYVRVVVFAQTFKQRLHVRMPGTDLADRHGGITPGATCTLF